MGKIKELQEKCILTFQAPSRPVYSLSRGCIHPVWRFPWPAEARQRQLKRIGLVTLSQGDAKVEGTQRLSLLPFCLSFSGWRSHAEWICDSLHKYSRERFLASLSCVFKSGPHHPLKKKKALVNQMTVLLDMGKECLCLMFIMEESAPVGCILHEVGVRLPCQGPGLQREWLHFKWFEKV